MKISRVRTIGLAAVAAFLSTGLMNAAQHATFHLPVAAHWGQTLLQPGDYKMLLPDASLGLWQLRVEGSNRAVYEMPLVTDTKKASDSSHLTLVKVNGEYFVHDFWAGPDGKSFVFYVPKTRTQQLAADRNAHLNVSVN